MSTLSLEQAEVPKTVDDFGALEQRVVRAIELVKTERAARAEAEKTVATLQGEIENKSIELELAQEHIKNLEGERDQVRQRVEKLLKQLDEISS